MSGTKKTGVLYVVATPIGNLEDITFRAVRLLREADLIACEDTRHSRKLLDHFSIDRPTVSYHEHNEASRAEELVERLKQGAIVAQVSDAGMPGISDPGYRVVQLAIQAGIPVVPVPGPSALIAALVASGLPTDTFLFLGFLPAKSGERRSRLEELRNAGCTVVLYEAPHRLQAALQEVNEVLGPDRPIVVARELTKVHEEFIRGTVAEVISSLGDRELKGEMTLLIGKAAGKSRPARRKPVTERLDEIMRDQQLDEKGALKVLAKEFGVSKSELYRELQRSRAQSKIKS